MYVPGQLVINHLLTDSGPCTVRCPLGPEPLEPSLPIQPSSSPLRVAVIPGDGVGVEVTAAACTAIDAAMAGTSGHACAYEHFDWGSERYLRRGAFIAEGGIEDLRAHDAILFGAVGWPTVPDHLSLWGLRLAICQGLDLGICVRPVQRLPNVSTPLRGRAPDDLKFVVVRENSEGEYSGVGGRVHVGLPGEVALQTSVVTREATERVARHAFEIARGRPTRHVINATKSNASKHACVLWDEVVAEVAEEYPDVAYESVLVDAMAARLVLQPQSVDVIVASNLHGDILSELTAALTGGLGLAPSSNLSSDSDTPSMFEPIHGSAPDLADPDAANPIGSVLSGAMLLEHCGETRAANRLRDAVAAVCRAGTLTPDVGGSATTCDVTAALVDVLADRDDQPKEMR